MATGENWSDERLEEEIRAAWAALLDAKALHDKATRVYQVAARNHERMLRAQRLRNTLTSREGWGKG